MSSTTTTRGSKAGLQSLLRSGDRVATIGQRIARYGLGVVLIWIGIMKLTAYEAAAIQPLVAHSPLMSWLYGIFDVRTFSTLLGIGEIGVGLLIAARRLAPRASAVGSALAVLLFAGTLSFILTTPGWEASLGGFPALSVAPGQFLLKDIVLLGVALWALGDSLREVSRRSA